MSASVNWIDRGLTHVAKTYGRYPLVAASGEGCWLTDVDGKKYLDFLAGVAVNNLGHCHPKIVKALQEQAATLIHSSNFYHIPAQIELAEQICANSFGERVFFCNSGAEANEAAIKLARKYSFDQGHKERNEVITAKASFHGRTLGTLWATGQEKIQVGFSPVTPGFKYVPFGDIEALRNTISDATCAIMLEPIQGEGGIHVASKEYLQAVRELCDKNNLTLIFDEVQVGMGRTGTLFAYQYDGIEPDIMSLAKGLGGGPPIGAMVARERLAESFGPGTHGSTFGGNPLVSAAALATIKVLLDDGVLEHGRAMGEYLWQQLEILKGKYDFITEIRGRGLMLGMQMTIEGAEIVKTAMERGLLINCTAGSVLRFVPPLVVSTDEIDQMIGILDQILSEI